MKVSQETEAAVQQSPLKFAVVVFSYNRGAHLRSCLEILERAWPEVPVEVVDDGSDDPEVLKVLDDYAGRIVVERIDVENKAKYGNLYVNMQRVYERTDDNTLLVCLQDDTQLIRRVTDADRQEILDHLKKHPNVAIMSPAFQRGTISAKALSELNYDADQQVYFFNRPKPKVAGMHYSDVALFHVGRLRKAGWRFIEDEFANDTQARDLFGRMPYLPCPWAMWVPNAPAYRNRSKNLAWRLGERWSRCGLYPFALMSDEQVVSMRTRDFETAKPVADDFLQLADGRELPHPWAYDPLKRWRLLRRLNEFEEWIKRVRKVLGI